MADTARRLNRRTFLITSGLATAVAATGVPGPAHAAPRARTPDGDPFTLGVASGDPDPDGFVLWTRLALDPLAEDGLGGMPSRTIPVRWEVATDERFRRVVRRGVAAAHARSAHSVHVELDGLRPGHDYWYRFRVGGHISPVGRTRTAPHPSTYGSALAMGFVSCSQFEHGYFTAYRRLAEEHPDLILHLGDYQYEYKKGVYTIPGGNVRDHEGPETVTLGDYRLRHAQYKSDPDLQAAHGAAPWLVVFDDHEVENNWADDVPENNSDTPSPEAFRARRAVAFQAYYENMPLRRRSIPHGPDIQVYRRVAWGRLANFHMLDTRQFRDDQACGDGYKDCPDAIDPKRSITGDRQERWLLDGFRRSRARWDILGQQVFFAQRDNTAGPVKKTSMDSWDGYVASRDRITKGWLDARVRNPVVLTGDVHAHWAGDLKADYDDPDSRTVGSELVCTSITSGGDGSDSNPADHPFLKINPHLRFYNNQRGYVLTKIGKDEMKADFKTLPTVRTRDAEASIKATFVIEDREPGVKQTYLRPYDSPRTRSQSDEELIRQTIQNETQP
ncbi:twin-arginine translocation signal domain-containing protein [Actinomadura spongiicola]|uniref:Twin-arginine translocation signal domain-containing protein n=1 Tax=Actinomadura spongiicola TaxID=2303421 RepID=A0A372GBQ5_9ACTN|nr:alkaline phosphatase D family protein [Actinomadura spongiicola]RFS82787.1 twin-arginine translocation signal domain-containing protein [Actinomadura spongiicola]